MKVALAQIRPVPGDVDANIAIHLADAARAATGGADLVIFPELSFTGYEPRLAASLARRFEGDDRWEPLQRAADAHGIVIGAGLPTRESAGGIAITHAFFRPDQPPLRYSKRFLHADETPYFVPGSGDPGLTLAGVRIAFAICYEISVAEHTAAARRTNAALFLASVAKSAAGLRSAETLLADLARTHGRTVALVNAVGPAEGFVCAGGSAVWNSRGERRAGLGSDQPGMLLFECADGTPRLLP